MNPFDRNLKRLRIERGMKQEDLAQRMHVTRQTISGWETGRRLPDMDTLKKLAEVLEADIHELIYGTKPEEYPRYQRRYVLGTAICGGIAAALMLFRFLIWPYFKTMCNTYHWGLALLICRTIMDQGCSFACGALIPLMIRLFTSIPINRKLGICCLIFGIALILPDLLLWLGVRMWSKWIVNPVGSAFLSYILPFISGICISLAAGTNGTE